MIKVFIVDDEPLSITRLSQMIAQDPEFTIIGTASNGAEALRKLRSEKADLVFLDVQMPEMNGIELGIELASWENPPKIVFATAFETYAVDAFKAHAIDYVLKPFQDERIRQTLAHIKKLIKKHDGALQERLMSAENSLVKQGFFEKIIGHRRHSRDRIVLAFADVDYFQSLESEVIVHSGDLEVIINLTLKELEEKLDSAEFVRTHKSYIVNVNKIQKICPMLSGNFEILLKGPKQFRIPLARRQAKRVQDLLRCW